MNRRVMAVFAALFVSFTYPAAAEDVGRWIVAEELDALLFEGPIDRHAAERFDLMLLAHPDTKTVALNSPGGFVLPALEIAEKIHDLGINTVIMEKNVCFSACAIMFMAGSTRYSAGELGVHQISGVDDSSITQQLVAQIYDALLTFGADRRFLNAMFGTASEDMYVFTEQEMVDLSINRIANMPATLEASPSAPAVEFDTIASSQSGAWEAFLYRNRSNGHYFCALQSSEDAPLIRFVNYLTKRDAFVEILNIPLPMQVGVNRMSLDFLSQNKEPIGFAVTATVENPTTAWFNIDDQQTGAMILAAIALYHKMKLETEDGRLLGLYDLSGSLKAAQAFSRCAVNGL